MQPAPTANPGSDPSGPTQPEAIAPSTATPRRILGRIGAVLRVVHTIIAYGRYLTANAPALAAQTEFATVAGIFGTYDLATILFRVQRGLRRALALQRYLLARSARGRNLRFAWPNYAHIQPHHRPPPGPPRARPATPRRRPAKEPAELDDDDPRAFYLPSDAEFDAEMRRRSIGRTMALIYMDLGVVPAFCGGSIWCDLVDVLTRYGGHLGSIYKVRERRAKTFERERDRRPDTWHWNWRDLSEPAVRRALGLMIFEAPPTADGSFPGSPGWIRVFVPS